MTTYTPPKRATEYIFYVALEDQANAGLFKANPTLAAGDAQVSTDGSGFTNMDTIPVVDPAAGVAVKVTVSIAEMTGENVFIRFVDASGDEWYDLGINIQTATNQYDDMALEATVGALNDISVADILTTQITEAYAADNTAPTMAQALFLIQQSIGDFSISGVTLTVKKLDGSTGAATYTLDDASDPTSRTRAT